MNLPLPEWQTFFAVQAGAAATLTGLVFVAVSLNLSQIMLIPGLPERAGESILQLLQVFFVAIAALVPRQPPAALAGEVFAIGIASWTVQIVVQFRYGRSKGDHPWRWLLVRAVLTQFATVPFIVAGILILLGNPGGLYWLVPGFVFSFMAAVMSAWVLLIEILR